jgi:hypothetical protein
MRHFADEIWSFVVRSISRGIGALTLRAVWLILASFEDALLLTGGTTALKVYNFYQYLEVVTG